MELKENYDVLIVGAGPAGLAAARKVAEEKLNALCVDKKQEIGAPKRCAEGLGLGWFKRLNLKPKKEWAVTKIFGAALYSPNGSKVVISTKNTAGYILERKMFEKYLARDAASKGANILTKCMVEDLQRQNGKVIAKLNLFGEEKIVVADIVIACDGVESKAARMLGINTTNKLVDIDAGFQYEMANIDYENPKFIHLFFGREIAPRGYVWIFPKGKHEANVGIGISGNCTKTAKEYLDKFVNSHPGLKNGSIIEVNCGCVPVGGFLEKMATDNLLIAGDAAHHVNPAHGGGIGIAMEAGQMAAEQAVKAFKKKDFSERFLSEYTKKWYEKRGNKLKRVLKARYMLETLTDDDFNYLAKTINGKDIMKIAEGDLLASMKFVTTKLVANPKLMGIMIKYLKS